MVMYNLESLGVIGILLISILIIFILISCLMWFLVPFWLIKMKNSLEGIQKSIKIIEEYLLKNT